MPLRQNSRRALHVAGTVFGIAICAVFAPILAINVTLVVKSVLGAEVPTIGGVFPLIVLTDSMAPEIESGDLAICRTTDPANVEPGDVIAFFDPASIRATANNEDRNLVLHRVIRDRTTISGDIAWETKGDANNVPDAPLALEGDLAGAYRTKIPGAGSVALFLQSSLGLVVCAAVLAACLAIGLMFRRVQMRRD